MKYLVFIIFFLWGGVSFSQDTIHIPKEELNGFFKALDTIRYQDSLKTVLLNDYKLQLNNYKTVIKKDSLILDYKLEEIKLLREQISLYDVRLKKSNIWYKKPWVGFITGTAFTLFTIRIMNYTLP